MKVLVELFQKLAQWRARSPPRPPQSIEKRGTLFCANIRLPLCEFACANSLCKRKFESLAFSFVRQTRVAICNERTARVSFHFAPPSCKRKATKEFVQIHKLYAFGLHSQTNEKKKFFHWSKSYAFFRVNK